MKVLRIDRLPNGLPRAEATIGEGETRDHCPLGFHPLPQTEVLRVIGVQCPQYLQYHPGQIVQMNLDILDKAGGIEKKLA